MSATTTLPEEGSQPSADQPHGRSRTPAGIVGYVFEYYSAVVVFGLIILLFGLIEPSTFLTTSTLRTILDQQAITVIMALALLLPLAAGVYDLSITGTMGLSIMFTGWLQASHHVGFVWTILIALAGGIGIGGLNAFVVVRLGVDSFIATLGTGTVMLGLSELVANGTSINYGISGNYQTIASTQLASLTLPFFYMLVLAVILWYVIEYRQIGRYMFATGSNIEAARLAGVRTDRMRSISLIVSGLIASAAGVIYLAQYAVAADDVASSYLLPAFAGALLGATQIKPGRVNVLGTLLAVFLLATGVHGLELAGAQLWVQDTFNGAALVIAVAFAVRAARMRRR